MPETVETQASAPQHSAILLAAASPMMPRYFGTVTIEQQADKAEANPGDQVEFRITVHNNSDATITGLNLFVEFSPNDFTVIDAGNGTASEGRIEWLNGGLHPQESKTLKYTARLNTALAHGHVVLNTVTLSDGGISNPAVATTRIGIMRTLPQTGAVRLQPLLPTQKNARSPAVPHTIFPILSARQQEAR